MRRHQIPLSNRHNRSMDDLREDLIGTIFQVAADLNRLEDRKGVCGKFLMEPDMSIISEKRVIDEDIRALEDSFLKYGKMVQGNVKFQSDEDAV